MSRELLFSLTKNDFELQFFRAGGKGGQKQNKTSSGCRIIHKESGAVGESREQRQQIANKKLAFQRLIQSPEFQTWHKIKSAAMLSGMGDIHRKVDEMMDERNLKIEYF
ncbi:MAG: peptide chain release factor-like protein [Synergistaceae bacterium]|jgi:protein subunit release factor B